MEKKTGLKYYLAAGISVLMNPLALPLYGTALMLYGPTIMAVTPARVRLFCILTVALCTLLIPVMAIGVMRSFNFIKSFSLRERGDRIVPLLLTAISYVFCLILISGLYPAFMVQKLLTAGLICLGFTLVVSLFWKISIHMTAAGSLLAMMLVVEVGRFGYMSPVVIVLILLCGALASARLYLGYHTPAQVAAGFLSGLVLSLASILLI